MYPVPSLARQRADENACRDHVRSIAERSEVSAATGNRRVVHRQCGKHETRPEAGAAAGLAVVCVGKLREQRARASRSSFNLVEVVLAQMSSTRSMLAGTCVASQVFGKCIPRNAPRPVEPLLQRLE
jgi:hypothetical protein